ncbi:MAG: hypothetical protein GYB42_06215 [Alphaproteobacteria bacterium]|nr:hypothetical protein [Alphaproteobacteria bacterium]
MSRRLFVLAALATLTLAGHASAGCALDVDELEDLVGYKIEAVKTVSGWIDEDDGKVGNEDDWEGCRYKRRIIFDDGTSLVCSSYRYSSAWGEQEAVIFVRHSSRKVCIDDEVMDVRNW